MSDSKPPPNAMPSEPDLSGRQLGDYQILRRLGRGGMAEVYLAEQSSLRRRVALKVLRSNLAAEDGYVRRFHNEAHAAAALVHANIVQIFEVGCVDGIHFIAQEYVEGKNLKQLVSRHGAIDTARSVLIMRQVAAALQKAGKHGIIHRDIKPENIMIGPGGEAKVADFGLARVTGDPTKTDLTQVGVTMGTPLYMSPEQVEGGPLDSRSDIYSLGVTCYHMLAGRPPFAGETALSVAVQHLKTEPEPLADLCPGLPSDLSRIVHKMLAKTPEERYASAAELLRELRQVQVEGWESDGSSDWLDLDTTEQLALSDTPIEATRRLEAVMRQSVETPAERRGRWRWVAILVGGLVGGSAVAWATRPADVLRIGPDEQLPGIQKMEKVYDQLWYAARKDTKEAWESVWKLFPPGDPEGLNNPYMWRAKTNLARLHRKDGDFDLALEIYDELAALATTERAFRAAGLVGQAICYHHLDNTNELAKVVRAAWDHRDDVDEEMRDELKGIVPPSYQSTGPSQESGG